MKKAVLLSMIFALSMFVLMTNVVAFDGGVNPMMASDCNGKPEICSDTVTLVELDDNANCTEVLIDCSLDAPGFVCENGACVELEASASGESLGMFSGEGSGGSIIAIIIAVAVIALILFGINKNKLTTGKKKKK